MKDSDMLNYAIQNGIIDIDTIQMQVEMNERKKYLKKHPYEIWEGKNGKWYTHVPDKERGRKKVKRTSEKDIKDFIVEFWKEAEQEIYVEDIFYKWVKQRLEWGEIQKQTYDRYEADYNRYFRNSSISKIRIQYITENDLENFIKSTIKKLNLTRKNWSNMRILVRGIFLYAKKHGCTDIIISQFISELELPKSLFNVTKHKNEELVFTKREVDMIFSLIRNNKKPKVQLNYLGIMLGFQTGLRIGELSALQYSDIDKDKITIHKTEIRYKDENGNYVYEVRDSAKTEAGNREVYLTDTALETIHKIRMINPFGEYVFMKNGERIKARNFTRHLYLLCEKAGLIEKSMHKARKTYATNLLNGNVDESLILSQMGHVELSTTKNYYYVENNEIDSKKLQLKQAINY